MYKIEVETVNEPVDFVTEHESSEEALQRIRILLQNGFKITAAVAVNHNGTTAYIRYVLVRAT